MCSITSLELVGDYCQCRRNFPYKLKSQRLTGVNIYTAERSNGLNCAFDFDWLPAFYDL